MLAHISILCNKWFEIQSRQKHSYCQSLSSTYYISGTQRGIVYLICSQHLWLWWMYSFIDISVRDVCLHVLNGTWIYLCMCTDMLWWPCMYICVSAQVCKSVCVFRKGRRTDICYSDVSVTLALSEWLLSCWAMQLSVPEKWVHST